MRAIKNQRAMTEAGPDWQTAMQVEHFKAARVTSTMQAIAAVPVFDGKSVDVEFFIKRMDLIVKQVNLNPLDEVTNNYVLGYFYSRIAIDVLTEIGASCETAWEEVKRGLREKYGGLGRTIPRTILKEVLVDRADGQELTEYSKDILTAVRKVKARLQDCGKSAEEIRIRSDMVEELAQEQIKYNLPRRVKQWIRISKPGDLESLVKSIEEEELEDKEERCKEVRRRPRMTNSYQEKGGEFRSQEGGWQVAGRRKPFQRDNRGTYRPPRREPRREPERRLNVRPYRGGYRITRRPEQCWECHEEGHFARECPYMYRRGPRKVWAGEPMEVNVLRKHRQGRRPTTDSESDGDSSMESRDSDWELKQRWPPLKVKKEATEEKLKPTTTE